MRKGRKALGVRQLVEYTLLFVVPVVIFGSVWNPFTKDEDGLNEQLRLQQRGQMKQRETTSTGVTKLLRTQSEGDQDDLTPWIKKQKK